MASGQVRSGYYITQTVVIVFLIFRLPWQSKSKSSIEHAYDLVQNLSFVERFFSFINLTKDNRCGTPVYILLCTFAVCGMFFIGRLSSSGGKP